ncbi:MAG: hypothetical protein IPK82_41165 [Polyangiaceae bacterium]|nr:hypothetical protein [Polyangiaceae bacterium]
MPIHRRGIWAETAPPEVLCDPATWTLLARYALEVAVAVRPGDVALAARVRDLAAQAEVKALLWPMIDDAEGRWLSVVSARAFRTFLTEVRSAAPELGIVLDLEPPLSMVRGVLDRRRRALRELFSLVRGSAAHEEGERLIVEMCNEIRAQGVPLTLALVPFVLWDGVEPGWAGLFGPTVPLPATRVNAMLYSTLIAGYSKGLLSMNDARAVVADGCMRTLDRFGEAAAVSLGAVGIGALGDEPVYTSPAELSHDVALAAACGVTDVWLFDLGGVLQRDTPERWLKVFTDEPAAVAKTPSTFRSAVVSRCLAAGARALSFGRKRSRRGEKIAEL